MKKYFSKAIFISVIVILGGIFNPLISHALPILGVTPDSKTVTLGDSFTLDITITDVTDLASFVFDVKFDSAILSVSSVTRGDFFPSGGSTFNPGSFASGEVSLISGDLLGFGPGVNGTGVLASIAFDSLVVGTSSIVLESAALEGSGFPVSSIPFDLRHGFVEVLASSGPSPSPAPVPEPASVVLLGSGLLALIVMKRKVIK